MTRAPAMAVLRAIDDLSPHVPPDRLHSDPLTTFAYGTDASLYRLTPQLVVRAQDERDVVVFGFAPHDSDLVLRVGFVNLIANAVEWAAPAAPDDPGAEPPRVLPATESRLDPVRAIPGALQGDFADRPATDNPLWRTLAWVALTLLLLEGLLPWGMRAVAWARGAWGRRKA